MSNSYVNNYDDAYMYSSGTEMQSSYGGRSTPSGNTMSPATSGRITPQSGRMTPNTPGGGYAAGPGIATVRHAQINSPLGLYNAETVAEEFSRQTGGVVTGVAGLPARPPADPKQSATYRAVQEEGRTQGNSPSFEMVRQMSQTPNIDPEKLKKKEEKEKPKKPDYSRYFELDMDDQISEDTWRGLKPRSRPSSGDFSNVQVVAQKPAMQKIPEEDSPNKQVQQSAVKQQQSNQQNRVQQHQAQQQNLQQQQAQQQLIQSQQNSPAFKSVAPPSPQASQFQSSSFTPQIQRPPVQSNVQNIPSGMTTPNTPGGGFAPGPGFATVRHAQLNSPMGLYNAETVAEEFSRQSGGIVTGVAGLPSKPAKESNESETYKAVHSQHPSSAHKSPSFSTLDMMSALPDLSDKPKTVNVPASPQAVPKEIPAAAPMEMAKTLNVAKEHNKHESAVTNSSLETKKTCSSQSLHAQTIDKNVIGTNPSATIEPIMQETVLSHQPQCSMLDVISASKDESSFKTEKSLSVLQDSELSFYSQEKHLDSSVSTIVGEQISDYKLSTEEQISEKVSHISVENQNSYKVHQHNSALTANNKQPDNLSNTDTCMAYTKTQSQHAKEAIFSHDISLTQEKDFCMKSSSSAIHSAKEVVSSNKASLQESLTQEKQVCTESSLSNNHVAREVVSSNKASLQESQSYEKKVCMGSSSSNHATKDLVSSNENFLQDSQSQEKKVRMGSSSSNHVANEEVSSNKPSLQESQFHNKKVCKGSVSSNKAFLQESMNQEKEICMESSLSSKHVAKEIISSNKALLQESHCHEKTSCKGSLTSNHATKEAVSSNEAFFQKSVTQEKGVCMSQSLASNQATREEVSSSKAASQQSITHEREVCMESSSSNQVSKEVVSSNRAALKESLTQQKVCMTSAEKSAFSINTAFQESLTQNPSNLLLHQPDSEKKVANQFSHAQKPIVNTATVQTPLVQQAQNPAPDYSQYLQHIQDENTDVQKCVQNTATQIQATIQPPQPVAPNQSNQQFAPTAFSSHIPIASHASQFGPPAPIMKQDSQQHYAPSHQVPAFKPPTPQPVQKTIQIVSDQPSAPVQDTSQPRAQRSIRMSVSTPPPSPVPFQDAFFPKTNEADALNAPATPYAGPSSKENLKETGALQNLLFHPAEQKGQPEDESGIYTPQLVKPSALAGGHKINVKPPKQAPLPVESVAPMKQIAAQAPPIKQAPNKPVAPPTPIIQHVAPPTPIKSVAPPQYPIPSTPVTPIPIADPSILLSQNAASSDLPLQQFNSPINLYSKEAAAEEYKRQSAQVQHKQQPAREQPAREQPEAPKQKKKQQYADPEEIKNYQANKAKAKKDKTPYQPASFKMIEYMSNVPAHLADKKLPSMTNKTATPSTDKPAPDYTKYLQYIEEDDGNEMNKLRNQIQAPTESTQDNQHQTRLPKQRPTSPPKQPVIQQREKVSLSDDSVISNESLVRPSTARRAESMMSPVPRMITPSPVPVPLGQVLNSSAPPMISSSDRYSTPAANVVGPQHPEKVMLVDPRQNAEPEPLPNDRGHYYNQPPVNFPSQNSKSSMDYFELQKLMYPAFVPKHKREVDVVKTSYSFGGGTPNNVSKDPGLPPTNYETYLRQDSVQNRHQFGGGGTSVFASKNPVAPSGDIVTNTGGVLAAEKHFMMGGSVPTFVPKNYVAPPNFGSAKHMRQNSDSGAGGRPPTRRPRRTNSHEPQTQPQQEPQATLMQRRNLPKQSKIERKLSQSYNVQSERGQRMSESYSERSDMSPHPDLRMMSEPAPTPPPPAVTPPPPALNVSFNPQSQIIHYYDDYDTMTEDEDDYELVFNDPIPNSDTGTFGMAYMSKSMIDETDMNKFKTISPPMYEDVREVPMDREIPIQRREIPIQRYEDWSPTESPLPPALIPTLSPAQSPALSPAQLVDTEESEASQPPSPPSQPSKSSMVVSVKKREAPAQKSSRRANRLVSPSPTPMHDLPQTNGTSGDNHFDDLD